MDVVRAWLLVIVGLGGCERSGRDHEQPQPPPGPRRLDDAAPPPAPDAAPSPDAGIPALTAKQVIESHPIGKDVIVDLIEPMRDDEHSSLPEHGEYDIEATDVGAARLVLAPAESDAERAAGALPELPAKIHAPIRVHGTVRVGRHPDWLVIVAHDITPLPLPTPAKVTVADLRADRTKWARAYVEIEDTYVSGFEASLLGSGPGNAWLDYYPDVDVRCEPKRTGQPGEYVEAKVRVRGWAYTDGQYGHMGGSDVLILATEVVYLDPTKPNCK